MATKLTAAVAFALLAAPTLAQAQAPRGPAPAAVAPAAETARPAPLQAFTALAGPWELIAEGGRRKCRITLRPQEAPGGRALAFPASCRRPIPIVARIAAWTVGPDGLVRLLDARGQVVLAFEEDAEPFRLKASADGKDYQLDSLGRMRRFVERTPPPTQQRAAFNPATAPPLETIPGLYGVLRIGEQEVCRINLTTNPAAGEGRFLASFPTRCRDRGLQVFDAVAWRYSGGRIFLIARRGHEIPLAQDGPNLWRRDLSGGQELWLRRAP